MGGVKQLYCCGQFPYFSNQMFTETRTTICHFTFIGHCRNVRGLGKSVVVFRLFDKLRYSNERSTKFESLSQECKCSEEENGKMVALQISSKTESLHGLGRQATKL